MSAQLCRARSPNTAGLLHAFLCRWLIKVTVEWLTVFSEADAQVYLYRQSLDLREIRARLEYTHWATSCNVYTQMYTM